MMDKSEKDRAYYAKNREKIISRVSKHYHKNRAKVLAYHTAYYADNREELNTESRARYKRNPAPYKERAAVWAKDNQAKQRESQRRFRANNRERVRIMSRWSRIKCEYGVTKSQYEDMLSRQNGVCAICGGGPGYHKSYSIDHCHKTGNVRGLLCSRCNIAIGLFRDNPELLSSAINYLRGVKNV